jgi:hypothetical protein
LALIFVVLFLPWVVLPTQTDKIQTGWQTGFGSYFHMLGTLHILSYLVALFLAIACVAVPALDPIVPPWVAEIWPWRSAILAAILFISLLFFLLEMMNGFGLEHAEFGHEYYAVHRTIWISLAWWLQVLAFVGALLDFWLAMRKTKPLPRIDISW